MNCAIVPALSSEVETHDGVLKHMQQQIVKKQDTVIQKDGSK